jgi:hypothetical protein
MIDPLKYLDLFPPHTGPVLNLPTVTSITVDDRTDPDTVRRLTSIIRWHRRFLRLGREVVLTGARPDVEGIEWVRLNKWKENYSFAYSRWCQMELADQFSTPYVLIWQHDGFALHPENWSDEFLRYDYVGKPEGFGVGCGGFCLRSKKFCEEARRLPYQHGIPEDYYLCVMRRGELESSGVSFAPTNVAERWSSGSGVDRQFGFHSGYEEREVFVRGVAKCMNRLIGVESQKILVNGSVWDGRRLKHPHA